MLPHTLYRPVKSMLPDFLANFIRRIATAFLTPIYFSKLSGHFHSSITGKPQNSTHQAIPWYTYPTIEQITHKNFNTKNVLEFGAGMSTLWWAQQAASVTAFESDPAWHSELVGKAPPNTTIHLVEENLVTVEKVLCDQKFDVIVIDGLYRYEAALIATRHLEEQGLIILDNSDISWGPNGQQADHGNLIADYMYEAGFSRIDYYGHAPAIIRPQATSIFFNNTCFLFREADHPRKLTE